MGTTNNFPAETPRKLFVGAFRDLERQFAHELAQRRNPLTPLHVVCPTRLLALHLQRTLGRALPHGHINVRFVTLADFSIQRPAPPLGLELLCRRIARDQLSRGYFAPVHDTAGFATALLATFTDLDEACLTTLPGKTPKLHELAAAYAEYRSWLAEHHFHTEADLYREPRTENRELFLYGFYDLNAVQRQFVHRLAPAAVFFPSGNEFAQPLLDWFQSLGYKAVSPTPPLSRSPTQILSCPGEPAEVREAFRVALDWLRANPNRTFNDIAILSRSRDQYDALFRDTLRHLGISALIRRGRPLAEHPDAKLLLLLLDAITTDYARPAVMELACHLGPHSDWDAFSMELGILGGRAQWLARLTSAVSQMSGKTERSFHLSGHLLAFVQGLFAAGEAVPQCGRWVEFVEPVLAAFRQFGGQHAPIIETVRALTELDPFQPRVTLAEFAACCRQALEQAHEPTLPFEGGGVFIGDVMSARGLSWPLVIVIGLVEKSFPRLIREDPLLLDDERRQISPNLPLKRHGHAEERMLFNLASASARERLVFSFPRIDAGSARPRLRSCLLRPFALEEKRIPLGKSAHDASALDMREFDLALLKAKRLPVALLAEMSQHLARGLVAERARWGEQTLTPHDGLAPAASAELPVSPTELETFAFCPFKYFCKQTLGLERWEEPEHIWSADPGEIGSAVHDILEVFYQQAVLPLEPKLRDIYRRQLRDLTEKRLAEFERDNVTGLPVVWSLRRAALLRDLLRFLDLEIERADDLVPREFEKKFGPTPVLRVTVCGRIDRVDTDGQRARILDYKTGKPWHKKEDAFAGGEALQLPLYALAAERAFGLKVVSSEYAYLSAGKYVRFSGDTLRNRAGELAQILETFAAMLRAGEFPQYAGHKKCGWCDYRPICGNAIEELAAKKIEDKRLAPFLAVKEIK